MKNLNSHTDSELLTLLLDGELSPEQSKIVQQKISNNPDLKVEKEQLEEITNAVKRDEEAFTPPTEAKTNVFAALGINEGGSTVPASVMSTASSGSNLWISGCSALVASLVTATMIFTLNSVESNNNNIAEKSNIPVTSSVEKDDEKAENINTEKAEAIESNDLTAENIEAQESNKGSDLESAVKNVASENESIESERSEDIASNTNNIVLIDNFADNKNIKASSLYRHDNSSYIFGPANEINESSRFTDYLSTYRVLGNSLGNGLMEFQLPSNIWFLDNNFRVIAEIGIAPNPYDAISQNNAQIGVGIELMPKVDFLNNKDYRLYTNSILFIGDKAFSAKVNTGLAVNLFEVNGYQMPLIVGGTYNFGNQTWSLFRDMNQGMSFFLGTEFNF